MGTVLFFTLSGICLMRSDLEKTKFCELNGLESLRALIHSSKSSKKILLAVYETLKTVLWLGLYLNTYVSMN
jgi:hypothetical protein